MLRLIVYWQTFNHVLRKLKFDSSFRQLIPQIITLSKCYIILICLSGLCFIINEYLFYDKTQKHNFKKIIETNYIFFDKTIPYSIIPALYDLTRYFKQDFKILDIIIFLIFYCSYVFYFLFTIPFYWIFIFYFFFKIIVCYFLNINYTLNKPNFENLSINFTKNSYLIAHMYWIKANAYLFVYKILKNRKSDMRTLIKNITILHLTGRPFWYLEFCVHFTNETKNILSLEIWKRKKLKTWPIIFLIHFKNLCWREYINKNVNYASVLKPLLIEIKRGLFVNGIENLLKELSIKDLLIYKYLKTLTGENGIPHLILCNFDKTSGQVFTSSEKIFIKSKNLFINSSIFHQNIINQNGKEFKMSQYGILSTVNPENVKDFILTNPFQNLQIKNTKEYIGMIFKLNILYYTEHGPTILNQYAETKDEISLREISFFTEEKLKKIGIPKEIKTLAEIFDSINEQTYAIEQYSTQQELKIKLIEARKEILELTFAEIDDKIQQIYSKKDYLLIWDELDKQYNHNLSLNLDY